MEELTIRLVSHGERWEIASIDGPAWLDHDDIGYGIDEAFDGVSASEEEAVSRRRRWEQQQEGFGLDRDAILQQRQRVRAGLVTVDNAMETLSDLLAGRPHFTEQVRKELEEDVDVYAAHAGEQRRLPRIQREGERWVMERGDGVGYRVADLMYDLALTTSVDEAARIIATDGAGIHGKFSREPWQEVPVGVLTGECLIIQIDRDTFTIYLQGDMAPVTAAINPYGGSV